MEEWKNEENSIPDKRIRVELSWEIIEFIDHDNTCLIRKVV